MAEMVNKCNIARRNCNVCNNSRTQSRNTANCNALSLRLKQVEFALTDVTLYLDVYPMCTDALAYYHRLLEERENLVEAINAQCGPLTIMGNVSKDSWQWINGPWPWNVDAN